MTEQEFKQRLSIALASNEEFIKQAASNYDGKMVWFSVSEQMNAAIEAINIKNNRD